MNAPHLLTVRVYYEDTDFSGAVYHASYLRFFERARTELLRTRGVEQADAMNAPEPFGFVVRSMTIDYLKPARMDDLLTIETRTVAIGAASLTLDQRALRGDTELVTAKVRVAYVVGGRAARMPDRLRAELSATL